MTPARVTPTRVFYIPARLRVSRIAPVCVRCACRARDARRERVRVIRFVRIPNDIEPKKNPIKSITYQLFWGNVKKVIDRVTVPASIGASKRQTLFPQSLRQPRTTCVSRLTLGANDYGKESIG